MEPPSKEEDRKLPGRKGNWRASVSRCCHSTAHKQSGSQKEAPKGSSGLGLMTAKLYLINGQKMWGEVCAGVAKLVGRPSLVKTLLS